MISYQTDSSAVRRSSAFSSLSAKAPSLDAPGASQPRLNCEETCARKAVPYLARWGAIKPPPGRGTAVDLALDVDGAVAALTPRLRRGRRAALRNFPPRAAGRGRSRLVGEEEEEQSDDQQHRCQGPDAERDPHSPAAARPRQLGALVVAGPCVEHGFLRFVQLGLGRALRRLGLLRRHDVRRRRFAGGRPSWGGAEELSLARRLGRWDLLGRFLAGIGGPRHAFARGDRRARLARLQDRRAPWQIVANEPLGRPAAIRVDQRIACSVAP